MKGFKEWMKKQQLEWRRHPGNVSAKGAGTQNRRTYAHVLPKASWEENLWPGLQRGQPLELAAALRAADIQAHTGVHNLLSSWVACANLYFPFRSEQCDRELVASFLGAAVDPAIKELTGIQLEWAGEGALQPAHLLGEQGGKRGSAQTSPDVAFTVRARTNGKTIDGVVLVESKLTEGSF